MTEDTLDGQPRRTVADALAGNAHWREHINQMIGCGDHDAAWAEKALARVDAQAASLRRFPPDMPLMTVSEALRSDLLDADQKWCVTWQRRDTGDYVPSPFESALFELVVSADDENLRRIELGFPVAARAYRRWTRERGFADSIRVLPIAFNI